MTSTGTAAVALTTLRKSFGNIHAVDGVTLTIAPGEVVGFLGPNGAGKSTVLDMVLGLTAPDSGTISVFGAAPRQAVRSGLVGAMLQSGALLPDVTVGQLVRGYASLHVKPMPVEEALRRAGIADLAKQSTGKLSGGQAQRVRFALALVPDPDLLVLDEPTVAMDVEVRRSFWASMREFTAAGRTVLFATHYLEEADEFADRVVVLANGQIVADGTGAAIKSQVSGRTIRAAIPEAAAADLADVGGVSAVAKAGATWELHCTDSDRALRVLLDRYPQMHDIEIGTADLEEAFLQITSANRQETRS